MSNGCVEPRFSSPFLSYAFTLLYWYKTSNWHKEKRKWFGFPLEQWNPICNEKLYSNSSMCIIHVQIFHTYAKRNQHVFLFHNKKKNKKPLVFTYLLRKTGLFWVARYKLLKNKYASCIHQKYLQNNEAFTFIVFFSACTFYPLDTAKQTISSRSVCKPSQVKPSRGTLASTKTFMVYRRKNFFPILSLRHYWRVWVFARIKY